MAVAENGGFAGRVQPIGVDERMLAGLDDIDVFEAGTFKFFGDEVSGALDVEFVLGKRADAGDAQELE